MNWKKLNEIMKLDGARLWISESGCEVFDPTWGFSKFKPVRKNVANAWLNRDLGVISEKGENFTIFRFKR